MTIIYNNNISTIKFIMIILQWLFLLIKYIIYVIKMKTYDKYFDNISMILQWLNS